MQAGSARSPAGRVHVRNSSQPVARVGAGNDQMRGTVTDQSGDEQVQVEAGLELQEWMAIVFVSVMVFPRQFSQECHSQLPGNGKRGMAHRSQSPEDVPALEPQPFTEVLL